jgi:DNA-binding beta-propeller fold protein YncE
MLVRTIDLAGHPPGPIEVEMAPGGVAVVAVGPGFFEGLAQQLFQVDVPGGGSVLLVDIEEGTILADLPTRHAPMGIAISADGTTAYTANFGDDANPGSTVSIIDLAARTIVDEIDVGPRPEQITLDPTGEWAMVNVTGSGIRLFRTEDPGGTLTEAVPTAADPSGVLFVPGTTVGVVANSSGDQNYSILDLSDPAAPSVAYQSDPRAAILYGATLVPGTTSVILPGTTLREIEFLRVDVSADPPVEEWSFLHPTESATLPLGIAITADGELGLCGSPGDATLVILDVSQQSARAVPWQDVLGPSYVALVPPG